ncbi:diphthine--ammonia ligase [Coemansia sp. RSA 2711]|nr:diphthine--ammonia ligase [Coemansia sp. RSA 2711]
MNTSACSGGKDSTYNMMKCVEHGHEIVALAHAHPPMASEKEELDSFLFQTVGSSAVHAVAECMELPLYTKEIRGTAVTQTLDYELTQDDETEDLFALLSEVKQNHPDVGAVSVGAIFSSYQGNRVQHVCDRLGLKMLAYLWHRDQAELLQEMVANGVDAVLIKVAAMGLGREDLGKTLKEMQPKLLSLHSKFGIHPCGEGGEFESFTLDCPLFKKRIVVDDSAVVTHVDDTVAPVLYLSIKQVHLAPK